jgi:hypothetical protein
LVLSLKLEIQLLYSVRGLSVSSLTGESLTNGLIRRSDGKMGNWDGVAAPRSFSPFQQEHLRAGGKIDRDSPPAAAASVLEEPNLPSCVHASIEAGTLPPLAVDLPAARELDAPSQPSLLAIARPSSTLPGC